MFEEVRSSLEAGFFGRGGEVRGLNVSILAIIYGVIYRSFNYRCF